MDVGALGLDVSDVNALKGKSEGKNKGQEKGGTGGKGKKDSKGEDSGEGKAKNFPQKMYRGEKKQRFEGACHHCGKVGHKEAECWNKQRGLPKAAALAITGSGSAGSATAPAADAARSLPTAPKKIASISQILIEDDDASWIFGLAKEHGSICSGLTTAEKWILLDSGSMASACRPSAVGCGVLEKPKGGLQSVSDYQALWPEAAEVEAWTFLEV
jgi:hypothetical protein